MCRKTARGRQYYYVHQSVPCKNLLIITRVDEVNRLEEDKASEPGPKALCNV